MVSRLPAATDLVTRVLHALRTKGMADEEAVARAAGVTTARAGEVLAELAERGWVRYRDGNRARGWMLLGPGRTEGERLVADQVEQSGCRSRVHELYRSFLVLDPELKSACTDFQVKDDRTVNDHTDPEYDAAVIGRLAEINRSARPIIVRLAAELDRFAHYRDRFDIALNRVMDGDIDWFTKPSVDSYHEVWFELHEDLLVTLGIDRAAEPAAGVSEGSGAPEPAAGGSEGSGAPEPAADAAEG